MIYPKDYIYALNGKTISKHFPKLYENDGQGIQFKSLKTDEYNCVAFVLGIKDDWIEFDLNINTYIQYFEEKGFYLVDDGILKAGLQKIALYFDSNKNEFKHVALQKNSGIWVSKIGDWEDIEHETETLLLGKSYGDEIVYMAKNL